MLIINSHLTKIASVPSEGVGTSMINIICRPKQVVFFADDGIQVLKIKRIEKKGISQA